MNTALKKESSETMKDSWLSGVRLWRRTSVRFGKEAVLVYQGKSVTGTHMFRDRTNNLIYFCPESLIGTIVVPLMYNSKMEKEESNANS